MDMCAIMLFQNCKLPFKLKIPIKACHTTAALLRQQSKLFCHHIQLCLSSLHQSDLWRNCHDVILTLYLLCLFDEALMTPYVSCNYSSAPEMLASALTGHCCDHTLHCLHCFSL